MEAQRQLVDYGQGSLASFPPVVPANCKILTNFGLLLFWLKLHLNLKLFTELSFVSLVDGRHGGNYNQGGPRRGIMIIWLNLVYVVCKIRLFMP